MKYTKRLSNSLNHRLFKKIVSYSHSILSNKTGYSTVFLNDFVSDTIQVTGLYESEILVPLFNILLRKFDFKDSTEIDVGANIGNHTVFFRPL